MVEFILIRMRIILTRNMVFVYVLSQNKDTGMTFINIYGGTISATAGLDAAGIGGGQNGD